jgi:hypothetical protein
MFKKRAQIQSQTLIYILALIIIVMVLFFGYQSVRSYNKKTNQVILIQFQNGLKKDVTSLSNDYGSIKIKEYKLPSGYDEICFVDLENIKSFNPENLIIGHPIILDSVKSGAKKNIFLFEKNNLQTFYVEELRLPNLPYYSCIQLPKSTTKLAIEGKGDSSIVKTPPNEEDCKFADEFDDADGENSENGEDLCDEFNEDFGDLYISTCCTEWGSCCPLTA